MDYQENMYRGDAMFGNIRLYCCGRRLDARGHSFGPAARDNYWIIYMQEGSGSYSINKNTFALRKNMIFVAFPNCRIHYFADPGSVWSIRWVCINADMLGSIFENMKITPENPIINVPQSESAENVLVRLFDEIPLGTVQSQLCCMSLVYSLLALMTEASLKPPAGHDYAEDAVYFMRHNYDRGITVKDVAMKLGLDRGYLSRLFRQRTGVAPSRWLNSFRMEKAAALLRSTDLTVREAALSVGFEDQLYFSRVFRKEYGVCPTEYKARQEDPSGEQNPGSRSSTPG